MKTLHLFTLLLFLAPYATHAQFAPVGAKWYYGNSDDAYFSETYYTYTCVGDTSIADEKYSKIAFADDKGMNEHNMNYYLTSDSNRVFYFHKGTKKLLFDFNKNIGDTFSIDLSFGIFSPKYGLQGDSTKNVNVVILSVTWLKNALANDSLKKYSIEIIPWQFPRLNGTAAITQKVIAGRDYSPPFSLINIRDFARIPEATNYLRCYSDSDYHFKIVNYTKACDYNSVGINEKSLNGLNMSLFPNPVCEKLYFRFSAPCKITQVTVYNVSGQIMRTQPIDEFYRDNNNIDVSALEQGIYYCELQTTTGEVVRSKFIKE
jgi:hypothetical protein